MMVYPGDFISLVCIVCRRCFRIGDRGDGIDRDFDHIDHPACCIGNGADRSELVEGTGQTVVVMAGTGNAVCSLGFQLAFFIF